MDPVKVVKAFEVVLMLERLELKPELVSLLREAVYSLTCCCPACMLRDGGEVQEDELPF